MQSIVAIIIYMALIYATSFCLYRAIDRKDLGILDVHL